MARVEFFRGTTKLGEDSSSPFSFLWSNANAGSYNLTARATDNDGGTKTSSVVAITVDAPNGAPTVSLTSPANGTTFTAPADITIQANASDSDGTVAKVEFFRGTTKLGEDSSSPYGFLWNNANAGSYNLTARATDNDGGTKTSSVVAITVDAPNGAPTVSLTSPANGASFTAPANITINASASDSDGTVAKVEFFRGTTKLGEDSSSPFSFLWSNANAGSYNLTARATDNDGGTKTSSVVAITVDAPNGKPTVSITSPANGATFTAPANITINASASDSDGTVSKVEFFRGNTKLGEDVSSPYSFAWGNVTAGSYNLTARATDNDGGSTTSGVVAITVDAPNGKPTVSISSPANGATFTAPANITINASASDSDGTVSKVEFFHGSTKLGEDPSSPYSFPWASVSEGSYNLTAKATDNDGGTKTSSVVAITVDAPNGKPTVSITSPANGATFTAPANITINASANDSDGTIAKVEFFHGSTKLGEDTSSPYSFPWASVSEGSYNLTAKATDNDGGTKTSIVVAVTVDAADGKPTVSITSPANGATFTAPANITIKASASDSDGTVSKVEFFRGNTKLGEDVSSPYSFAWDNVGMGSYTLTARAMDNEGGTKTSSVAITVNSANSNPTVNITNPANGATFTAPANITINASASDSDGTVSKVEFFRGNTKVGEDVSSPYSFALSNVGVGSYTLTARAMDNDGGTKTSSVAITVNAVNGTPTVSITSPANGATLMSPADITIKANASDSDGNIAKVEFFRGTTKLGEDSSSPYSFLWSNANAGSYNLTAKATDNDGGTKTSSAVAITVNVGTTAFMDEFNDGDLSNWSYEKGEWMEQSGDLRGNHDGKATIFPTFFGGCSKCTIETQIMMGRDEGKVSLFGWYQDKKNNVELIMDEKKDRWIFKQKFNGETLDKQKIALKIDPNKNYPVKITFNGSNFQVFVQNTLILTSPAGWSASGTVGLQIMNTSIAVERVKLNN